jgi:peptidoglycan/LPS O-acetylase OafA/YrhL
MIPYEDRNYAYQGMAFAWRAILNGKGELIGIALLVALLGIGFIFSIAKIIQKIKLGKVFVYLGVSSVGIYLLHILFLGLVKNFWLNTALDFIITLGLYEILKRIKITNWLLFGKEMSHA